MWWEHIYGENTTQVVAGIRGNAKIVVCLYASRLPPCSTHKARGSSSPAPASINQPSGSHLPLALRWQCRAGLLSDMTNAAKKSLQADAVLYLFACVYCSVFVLRCQPAMIRGSKLKTIPIYTHYYATTSYFRCMLMWINVHLYTEHMGQWTNFIGCFLVNWGRHKRAVHRPQQSTAT